MNDARLDAFLDFEHVSLIYQTALDLQNLTGLQRQLHQSLVAWAELGDVALQAAIPDLQDVSLGHALIERQTKLCGTQARLQQ